MPADPSPSLAGPELIDPACYARDGYPHETWRRLRDEDPVHYYEGPDYPFWALTRHADIVEVSRQPELFSNQPRFQIAVGADYGSDDAREPETIIHMDPPRHRDVRGLLSRRFTPGALRAIEAGIESLAREIVDRLLDAAPEGEVDFVDAVAGPLPLAAIAWLLDLPRADWADLYHWTNAVVGSTDPEYQRPGESAHETRLRASEEIYGYFHALLAERAKGDGDDLVSGIARAGADGASLTPHEQVSYCLLLIAGGTETTRNALSSGLLGFFDFPDQWRRLVEEPGRIRRATEEVLRWSTPVVQMARTPVRDVELRGKKIRAGETIALFYGSGNRDERVFADPFRLDIDRFPNPHLALGVGEHYCMGANLARIELRAMLGQLATRLETIEPAGPPERLRSSTVGGVKKLPVRYRRRASESA